MVGCQGNQGQGLGHQLMVDIRHAEIRDLEGDINNDTEIVNFS